MSILLPAIALLIAATSPAAAESVVDQLFAAASPPSLPEGCEILGPIKPETRPRIIYHPVMPSITAQPEVVYAISVLRDAWRNTGGSETEIAKTAITPQARECILANLMRYPGMTSQRAGETLAQVSPCGSYQCPGVDEAQRLFLQFGMID